MKPDGNGNIIISVKLFAILPVLFTIIGGVGVGAFSIGKTLHQLNVNTENICRNTENVKKLIRGFDKLNYKIDGLIESIKDKQGPEKIEIENKKEDKMAESKNKGKSHGFGRN